MIFKVFDKELNKCVDPEDIVLDKNTHLFKTDINCFALCNNGQLIITDDCGYYDYLDMNRFEVIKAIKD